jgi:hypothetical protein
MATLTISFVHPQDSFSREFTLPDAHMARMVQAFKARYEHEARGTPQVPFTNQQVLQKLTAEIVQSLRSAVLDLERKAAAETAVATVGEIVAA